MSPQLLTEQQVSEWGQLSVNERRKALIEHFGYGLLAQVWSELEDRRPKAPADIKIQTPDPTPDPEPQLAPSKPDTVSSDDDSEPESATTPKPKKKGK